jgi:hypothetical protein
VSWQIGASTSGEDVGLCDDDVFEICDRYLVLETHIQDLA